MGVELHCDVASLELARSGAIWGDIWIEIDGDPFPEANWNDMPVAFLAELFDAVDYVRSAVGRSRRVRFFDGPFWINLAGRSGSKITISVNSYSVNPEIAIMADELNHSMTLVSSALMEACQNLGWGDQADVRRLRMLSRC
jgi:hypothetical protein